MFEYILDYCKDNKIYIYGAGQVGKQCLSFLRQNGYEPEGFIVTGISDQRAYGLEVISLDSYQKQENFGIIIAGSMENSVSMQKELVRRHITDYVFYKEELEVPVRNIIKMLNVRKGINTALYGIGLLMKAVRSRLEESGDAKEVFLEESIDAVEKDPESFCRSLKEGGIQQIIIVEDAKATADVFIRLRALEELADILLYDVYGRKLERESFVEGNLESNKAKCALVIDSEIPRFDRNAGARLSFFYMRCFKQIGYCVWFLPLCDDNGDYRKSLTDSGIHVADDTGYGKIWLSVNGWHFDMVFLQRPECAEYYLDDLTTFCPQAKLIYHPADLHFVRLMRQYELTGDESIKRSAEHFKNIEYHAIETSDYIYVVGSEEKKTIEDSFPGKPVRDIPIFLYDVEDIPERSLAKERKDLIFVGGFNHAPNVDAVKWFAVEILPEILKELPDVVCHVVGGDAPDELLALGNEHLIFDGYLSDEELKRRYEMSRISVAPLRFGAGIKGKIIEAGYYGLPVVTTAIGAEGVHEADQFIMVADDAHDFAYKVIDLYNDLERIDAIAQNTVDVIRNNYTSRVAENILKKDLDL